MPLDFTYNKYADIISIISKSDYKVIRISDYIQSESLPERFIIIRHDVDHDPYYQVKFAELEQKHNIYTTYYFRYTDTIFKEEVIDRISQMGHEIGYHYEVFTKTRGDVSEALRIFREEQAIFNEKWQSITVCPHGGSFVENTDGYSLQNIIKLIPRLLSGKTIFSKNINFNMWDHSKCEDYNIIGDAYHSIDFSDVLYLSDTGRSWDDNYKRLDKVYSEINTIFNVKSSDDIIRIIKNKEADKIYLLIHVEQWKDKFIDWVSWYAAQLIRRNAKKLVFGTSWSNNNHE
jgi:hypothetical protein